jgi:glycerol uptake facilitator-like aquaporin
MTPTPARKFAAEFLGTTFLLAAVVGSGIMGDRLSAGNAAVALLANAVATGAALLALILTFGPISGAHFNPVVTLLAYIRREISARLALGYAMAQFAGAVLGVMLAHAMFAVPLLQQSIHIRAGGSQFLSEMIATAGLLLVISSCAHHQPSGCPYAVSAYIVSAYWFTASTSFANPAVTLARTLTNTFSGIAFRSAPMFVLAQLVAVPIVFVGWRLLQPTLPPANRK